MNIEQANKIPLADILEKIGPAGKKLGQELVYSSPFRDENTPSFHVNPNKNLWFDFGAGQGGSVVSFVCAYLKSQGVGHAPSDALRWIRNMTGYYPRLVPVIEKNKLPEKDTKLFIAHIGAVQHPALFEYLKSRGIPLRLASQYLSEVSLYNKTTKKTSFALGFKNEEGGYELRNPYLKITLRQKDITFIRGTIPKPDGIHFFEGFMDFLSALAYYNIDRFKEDALIFNSLALMDAATPLVRNYGYRRAYSWMDNDAAGRKATAALQEFCATEENLCHRPMNGLYAPHKDVNEWWVNLLAHPDANMQPIAAEIYKP